MTKIFRDKKYDNENFVDTILVNDDFEKDDFDDHDFDDNFDS